MKEEQIIAGFIRTAIRNPSKQITVKEISSESKINRTYFYQFFDSEEDIAIETVFSLISAFINRIFPSFFCLNCVNRSAVEKGVQDLIVHKEILEALLLEQPKTGQSGAERWNAYAAAAAATSCDGSAASAPAMASSRCCGE